MDALSRDLCGSTIAQQPWMKKLLFSVFGLCTSSIVRSDPAFSSDGSSAAISRSSEDATLSLVSAPGDHESCPADSPWSCSAGTTDSCCYEGNNGIFLQTQFWDYNPATGPNTTWTLHGLWNDRCTGGYRQFCNPSWAITSAESTLRGLGMDDLVETMSEVWKNQGSNDNSLWTHEFNKHGTCMSTVSPKCYSSDQPAAQNVGDFFNRTVSLYQELTTYEWLAAEGILPSEDKRWNVAEFSDALARHTDGRTVYLGCDRNNAVYQVWYFFSLRGSVADGEFKFIDSITTSSCTDGFKYLPKNNHNGGGGGGGGGDGDSGDSTRSHISVVPTGSSSQQGCLISDGSWFTSGTCATFRFKETVGGVSVSSSKGPCGIINGKFQCSRKTEASDFEIKDKKLTYNGEKEWSAANSPGSNQRIKISPNGDGSVVFELDTGIEF